MHVLIGVAVKNLVEAFFRGDFDVVVVLGKRVDDADHTRALRQITNHIAGLVLPPGHSEVRIPLGIGVSGRHVQETTLRTHDLS